MRLSDSPEDARKGGLERSVSRVLFLHFVAAMQVTFIRLGLTLPPGSSSLPGSRTGRPLRIWPCTRWGIPGRPCHQGRRWSLTPPFRPYPSLQGGLPGFSTPVSLESGSGCGQTPKKADPSLRSAFWRFAFCCAFLRVTATGGYPAPCPVVPGLSSDSGCRRRTSGPLQPGKGLSDCRLSDESPVDVHRGAWLPDRGATGPCWRQERWRS